MAWQVDQVAAVNAITNIAKRMRHIGASASKPTNGFILQSRPLRNSN